MKVCLCTSPHLDHNFYYQAYSEDSRIVTLPFVPLGLLSLGACLETRCEKVEIIDLNKLVNGAVPNDQYFYRNVAALIQRHGPDILGFMTEADSYHHVLAISKECKKLMPRTTIILGGPHASVTDYETLRNFPFIDLIVRGEGEVSIAELIDGIKGNKDIGSVNGISYRSGNGDITRNEDRPLIEDLDTLPVPAYHLYDISPTDCVYVEAGRGCPRACTFCFTAPYWKRQYRVKSPERIISEMALLREQYHVCHLNLVHDLFTTDRRWVQRFCSGVLESNLGVTWTCSSRTDTVDGELVGLMARTGCKAIYYGLEVGSNEMQETVKKRLDLQDAMDIIRLTMSHGIEVTVGIMLGFPRESEASVRETTKLFFSMLRTGVPKVNVFRVCPFRGSPMHEDHKDTLYFDGHFLDLPLCRTLQRKNLGLMRRHPGIFSGYYRYKTQLDDEDFLKGIDELSPIMGLLRYPILAVLEGSGDELGLLKEWARWIHNHNRRHRPEGPLTYYGTVEEFLLFLKDMVKGGGGKEYVTDLIQYETIKNELRKVAASASVLSAGNSGKRGNVPKAVHFPKKSKHVRIKRFSYDVKGIIERLRLGSIGDVDRKSCYVMFFVNGLGELNTAKINRHGVELIGLCDGRLSIQDIASKFVPLETPSENQVQENVINAVRKLREMNVIEEKANDLP